MTGLMRFRIATLKLNRWAPFPSQLRRRFRRWLRLRVVSKNS